MTCDYCAEGIPVVCGECGAAGDGTGHHVRGASILWRMDGDQHHFRPVHRIPDPEGIEGTAVVPCVRP